MAKKPEEIDAGKLRERIENIASAGKLSKVTKFDGGRSNKIPATFFKYDPEFGNGLKALRALTLKELTEELKMFKLPMLNTFETLLPGQTIVSVSEDIFNLSSPAGQKISEFEEGLSPEEMKEFAWLMST